MDNYPDIREKILITGGHGLVGKALQNALKDYKKHFLIHFLSSKECDLTDWNSTRQIFNVFKPDYVIHLAACVGGLYKNMTQKVKMFEENMDINSNVIKCCHKYKVKKLVSCLSTCIFPDKTTYPINEKMLHDGPPHHSNDSYAYAKRMLDIHSKSYRENYDSNFICVIPTNIYGKHDNYSLENGHVIPALIHRCYLSKKNNENFIVKGSGKALRQFIYSNDLAKLLVWSLLEYEDKENVILSDSPGNEVSIKTIATCIANEFDYLYKMIFDEKYSDGQYRKTADNAKLMNLLNETNSTIFFTDIQEGIKHTVKWFIENYETCRK